MGQTLITANATGAHTLVDNATWARHGDKDALHVIHDGQWGDTTQFFSLDNPYGYVILNPDRIPGINAELAKNFGAWLTSPKAKRPSPSSALAKNKSFNPT